MKGNFKRCSPVSQKFLHELVFQKRLPPKNLINILVLRVKTHYLRISLPDVGYAFRALLLAANPSPVLVVSGDDFALNVDTTSEAATRRLRARTLKADAAEATRRVHVAPESAIVILKASIAQRPLH